MVSRWSLPRTLRLVIVRLPETVMPDDAGLTFDFGSAVAARQGPTGNRLSMREGSLA